MKNIMIVLILCGFMFLQVGFIWADFKEDFNSLDPEIKIKIRCEEARISVATYYVTGNRLYGWMKEPKEGKVGGMVGYDWMAIGYIMAVADSAGGKVYKLQGGTKSSQVYDVVKKFIEDYPEKRNAPAYILCLYALAIAWPLDDKDGGEVG